MYFEACEMISKRKVKIRNKLGLHARPAAIFVQIANKFDSVITVTKGNQKVDGKSIMGIMMLAAGKGDMVHLCAEGDDAEEAIRHLEKLLSGQMEEVR